MDNDKRVTADKLANRIYRRRWYEKHKEEARAKSKKFYHEHKEEILARRKVKRAKARAEREKDRPVPLARYQCEQCKIHRYSNGKCYADRKSGRPVEEYYGCAHAGKRR